MMMKFRWMFILVLCTSSLFAQRKICILHTNDTHSQIEPISKPMADGASGGYLQRITLIKRLKAETSYPVIVFDSGDFSQGTPYYNFFKGRVEVALMNRMGLNAVAVGNHEFDNGLDTLAKVLADAQFPMICSNVNFDNTPLKGMVKPYEIIETTQGKVGVFALLAKLDGLVSQTKSRGVVWTSPYDAARKMVKLLRGKEQCDLIVCLSHLDFENSPFTDQELGRVVSGIDVILGGHAHKLIKTPLVNKSPKGENVYLQETGSKGLYLGRMDIQLR
jgi:5'-nucleotidase